MTDKFKCNYCKKLFDDLHLLDNPERQICTKCLEKHPRLKKKWEFQFDQTFENFRVGIIEILDGLPTAEQLKKNFSI